MRIVVRPREYDAGVVEVHAYTDTGLKLVPAGKEHDRFADPGYGPFAVEAALADLGEPTLVLPRELYVALAAGGHEERR